MQSKIDWRKFEKVYNAIERASLMGCDEKQDAADAAMTELLKRTISVDEFNYWLNEEESFRKMGGWCGEWDSGVKRVK